MFQLFPLAEVPLVIVVFPKVLSVWLHVEPLLGLYPFVIVMLPNELIV